MNMNRSITALFCKLLTRYLLTISCDNKGIIERDEKCKMLARISLLYYMHYITVSA